jgi:hypothetical protein
LSGRHDCANGNAAWPVRAGRACAFALVLALGLSGCRRRVVLIVIPPVAAQIALETPPPMANPPEIATPPPLEPEVVELSPVMVTPPTPPRRRTPAPAAAQPPVQPPVQVAANTVPDAGVVAIGELSTGGNSTPQSQQEAKDLIGAITKRIAGLSSRKAYAQRGQVRQVRHFLDQAQQALNSGDAEGAKTLATKAKLLMDDVEK